MSYIIAKHPKKTALYPFGIEFAVNPVRSDVANLAKPCEPKGATCFRFVRSGESNFGGNIMNSSTEDKIKGEKDKIKGNIKEGLGTLTGNQDQQFVCAACGGDFDRETAVVDCRVCHRQYCRECLDDQGLCTPCSEEG